VVFPDRIVLPPLFYSGIGDPSFGRISAAKTTCPESTVWMSTVGHTASLSWGTRKLIQIKQIPVTAATVGQRPPLTGRRIFRRVRSGGVAGTSLWQRNTQYQPFGRNDRVFRGVCRPCKTTTGAPF
jgi:hypothetical protein